MTVHVEQSENDMAAGDNDQPITRSCGLLPLASGFHGRPNKRPLSAHALPCRWLFIVRICYRALCAEDLTGLVMKWGPLFERRSASQAQTSATAFALLDDSFLTETCVRPVAHDFRVSSSKDPESLYGLQLNTMVVTMYAPVPWSCMNSVIYSSADE